MIQAGAIYEGQYFLGTSIARPLIAKRMVEIARAEKADAIAHGATGKGNDQVRFELTAAALAPELQVIAPWREERFRKQFPGRAEMIAFAKSNKIPVQASAKKPYSMDRNLLHISFESGILEDPWFDASARESARACTSFTVSPEDAPDKPEYVELDFERELRAIASGELQLAGRLADSAQPVAICRRSSHEGAEQARRQTRHRPRGHGGEPFRRHEIRGVYETPGGAILHFAHRQMESLTMDREVMHLRDALIPKYSELVYNGFWFAPEREALQALVTETQKNVTGTVRLKLYKGNIIVAGRKTGEPLQSAHRHDGERTKGLQPERRHRLHPLERAAPESSRSA